MPIMTVSTVAAAPVMVAAEGPSIIARSEAPGTVLPLQLPDMNQSVPEPVQVTSAAATGETSAVEANSNDRTDRFQGNPASVGARMKGRRDACPIPLRSLRMLARFPRHTLPTLMNTLDPAYKGAPHSIGAAPPNVKRRNRYDHFSYMSNYKGIHDTLYGAGLALPGTLIAARTFIAGGAAGFYLRS